jgi:hypothetical protein
VPAPVSEVLCSPWAELDDIPQKVRDEFGDDITDDQVTAELLRASELLWMLSGRVWYGGGCTETATLRSLPPPGTESWPYAASWGRCRCWSYAGWSMTGGVPARGLPYGGTHLAPMAVQLPRSPVTGVTQVTVDGQPFEDWQLLRSGWIERTDGQAWNVCDNNTEITYQFGEPPPSGGREAAAELAVEFIKYKHKLDGCRLPRKATQLTRQGLSITIDPLDFLDSGGTGLLGVDAWLRAVNPHRDHQPATVWSPDLPRTMRS